MDDITLTALKQSIEKWEKRAAGEHDGRLGVTSCPLCRVFHMEYREDDETSCTGCPVFEATGSKYCYDTPYLSYREDETNQNAQRELDFLKSLLPPEEVSEKKDFSWVDLKYLG